MHNFMKSKNVSIPHAHELAADVDCIPLHI